MDKSINIKQLDLRQSSLEFKQICLNIIKKFCDKQELPFEEDCFVGSHFDALVMISDYVFNLTDIYIDLYNEVEKGKILEWYDYCQSKRKCVNYAHYIMNLR